MGMELGIDFGGSFTDCVVLDQKKVVFSHSIRSNEFDFGILNKQLAEKGFSSEKAFVTGRKKELDELGAQYVDEISAIGRGASSLCRLEDCVVASVGTGTALVAVSGNDYYHLGGTGVGGGTLEGLSNLLLKSTVVPVHQLALHSAESLDLLVADVLGADVGVLSQDATASNFGGFSKPFSPASVGYSIFSMVGETVGVCASLACQKENVNTAVFVGRCVNFELIRKRISVACKIFSVQPVFPKTPELATAIGAALEGD
ncbi:MAG: hypothetical protein Q7R47_01870 [Candidatus Diapherotrites archaeon]|nr:hypothetical protein [Candidatus Diapherotrites archaeon]